MPTCRSRPGTPWAGNPWPHEMNPQPSDDTSLDLIRALDLSMVGASFRSVAARSRGAAVEGDLGPRRHNKAFAPKLVSQRPSTAEQDTGEASGLNSKVSSSSLRDAGGLKSSGGIRRALGRRLLPRNGNTHRTGRVRTGMRTVADPGVLSGFPIYPYFRNNIYIFRIN